MDFGIEDESTSTQGEYEFEYIVVFDREDMYPAAFANRESHVYKKDRQLKIPMNDPARKETFETLSILTTRLFWIASKFQLGFSIR